MRALVTGAEGFVGRHLIAHLRERDDRVTATFLSGPPDPRSGDAARPEGVRWTRLDVRAPERVARVVEEAEPDAVYHLAGFSSGQRARTRPAEAFRTNAEGTLCLLEGIARAVEAGAANPVVLVAGSSDAYGRPRRPGEPIDEEQPLRPESPYGLSKAAQELVAETYRRRWGVRVVVARVFPLVGPGQDEAFVVPAFCAQAAAIAAGEVEPVLQVGNLDVERDFTDVRDGVRAFRLLAERGDPGPFNVGSGRAVPVRRLLEWILEAAGIEPEIRIDPARVRPDEPRRVVADVRRIREAVGWRAGEGLADAVRDAYRWCAERREGGREGAWTSR